MRHVAALILGAVLVCGCNGDDAAGEPTALPEPACAEDELTLSDGQCLPVGPAGLPCPPGEVELAGLCVPAGVPPDGCAEGFEHDGDRGCTPQLPDVACGPGTMAVLGDAACRSVADCGTGTWGGIPSDGNTQHVDASYTGGNNNGSAGQPWTTIQSAIAAAGPGDTVAIAAGTYTEDVSMSSDVTVWGRCPDMVTVAATGGAQAAVSILSVDTAVLRGVSVTGPGIGVLVSGAVDVLMDQIRIHDTTSRGLSMENTLGPTRASLRRSLVESATDYGVIAVGATVLVEESLVRGTTAGGECVTAENHPSTGGRGNVSIAGSVVERCPRMGVACVGCDLSVVGTLVRDIVPRQLSDFGRGIDTAPGGDAAPTLHVEASVIERTHEIGIFFGAATGSVERTVVRDTSPHPNDPVGGWGIGVQDSPDVTLRPNVTIASSLVDSNHAVGIIAVGSDLVIESTAVRRTQPNASGLHGRGLGVQDNQVTGQRGSLVLRAALLEGNAEAGMVIASSDATIEATHVRDTVADGLEQFGDGVMFAASMNQPFPAVVELRNSIIERSARAGVGNLGASATLTSVLIMCQAFDIDSEPFFGFEPQLVNGGRVGCGCPEPNDACKQVSVGLQPPDAIPPP